MYSFYYIFPFFSSISYQIVNIRLFYKLWWNYSKKYSTIDKSYHPKGEKRWVFFKKCSARAVSVK